MKSTLKHILFVCCILLFSFFVCSSVYAYAEKPLSEFSTKFNLANTPRVGNIKLASIALDQQIIQPGETFSFNEIVGPTTKERGYQVSKVIVQGAEKKGYGGGVCQVSSTLFNAAQMAGLEITERHSHSKEVAYIEKDKDAATSYGGADLKLTNNFPYPVKINTYVYENSINIAILKYF